MSSFSEGAIEVLRQHNYRITEPRRSTVDILAKSSLPLSPYDISKIAENNGSHLDTVTVYRVLETLQELGLVHKLLGSGKFRPCELSHQHHHEHSDHGHSKQSCHHLVICEGCGDIRELTSHPQITDVVPPSGFKITGHRLEFFGLCERCAKAA